MVYCYGMEFRGIWVGVVRDAGGELGVVSLDWILGLVFGGDYLVLFYTSLLAAGAVAD